MLYLLLLASFVLFPESQKNLNKRKKLKQPKQKKKAKTA
ncbi:hypothetical protein AE177_11945 [Listeria monocytogenes]|nr:hypothetical protein [Listeria monocytogenes]EAD1211558.1 hypothetical protein [Listeria monocytogenes]EAD1708789.1 hypothetical protein [Listeria monocytogenes]EAD5793715.1 hypothetical protein [Listeria monocytogenes]EAD8379296.1 hypothetical protein [Listeria monocytogenes]